MSNVLSTEKREQVVALGRLGWPLRRIEDATGVPRETAGAYLRAAGITVRPLGGWGRHRAKPAIVELPPPRPDPPTASSCEPYREIIDLALRRGRNAMAVWQDLVVPV